MKNPSPGKQRRLVCDARAQKKFTLALTQDASSRRRGSYIKRLLDVSRIVEWASQQCVRMYLCRREVRAAASDRDWSVENNNFWTETHAGAGAATQLSRISTSHSFLSPRGAPLYGAGATHLNIQWPLRGWICRECAPGRDEHPKFDKTCQPHRWKIDLTIILYAACCF
jgi:hypothetical protein